MTTFPIALEQADVPRRRYGRRLAAITAVDVARRVLNVTLALVALIAALPLLAIIAIAVKLSSPGPVFYSQTRVGLNRRRLQPWGNRYRSTDCGGKPFTILKFRTMRVNGETKGPDEPGQVWATPDDPRVTRIGRILRLYRLDELPQLVNVLLGDMDIVGPRPEQPAIFTQLREQIPGYQARQRVRPGITGWAQINQAYDTSVEDVRNKLRLDLDYIRRQSAPEDLKIMVRTFPVMLFGRGAR